MRTPFRERYMKRKLKCHYVIVDIVTDDDEIYDYQYRLNVKNNHIINIEQIRDFTQKEFEKSFKKNVKMVLIKNIIKDIK
jgi:hypothetical protein